MSNDLSRFSDAALTAEINRREEERRNQKIKNMNPVGTWEVTTEGDCEGRTVNNLGVYEGHIVDIAKALASKCCYTLQFSPAKTLPKPEESKNCKEVSISLGIESGTWDIPNNVRVALMSDMLHRKAAKTAYYVVDGQYHASVKLEF